MDTYVFDLDENVTRMPVSFKNRYGITSPRTSTGQGFRHLRTGPRDHRRRVVRRCEGAGLGPLDKLEEFFAQNLA
ncbi:hypothetical protein ACFPH6_29930 [Streptomyces xiangluensis]|uniref:Uncharacterized protein n=1 Tax=Streptomyces xiangluensis TaxID=2665720 RepID=A0ABV8YTW8_9ACTN